MVTIFLFIALCIELKKTIHQIVSCEDIPISKLICRWSYAEDVEVILVDEVMYVASAMK